MNVYKGVVEDNDDPLKLGRVRVRVFGLHTDDTSLIPTDCLPWAIVSMPTTSASMSGIGESPSGLLPGSWVLVIFQDPDKQYPIVLGSFHGLPEDSSGQSTTIEDYEYSDSEAVRSDNVLKDSSGSPVTDSSGEPIKVTPPPTTTSPKNAKFNPSELGSVSSEFESSGNPGAINDYKGGAVRDGAAYGLYQMVSYLISPGNKSRSNISDNDVTNSPINTYLRTSQFKSNFSGMSPASAEFDAMWKKIASQNKAEFIKEQHAYAERVYYQTAVNKLPSSITNRGRAIHEAIWSMSIQLGPGLCVSTFNRVLGNVDKNVPDSKVVEILYDARIASVKKDFVSSPKIWSFLENGRFPKEKNKLIAMAKSYESQDSSIVAENTEVKTVQETQTVYGPNGSKTNVSSIKTVAVPLTTGRRGFTDPSGKYPLYTNEADTHKLARGIVTGTIIAAKRAAVLTGREAGWSIISEPTTQYNAKYPHNKVTYTASGHVIELDDTPGYERVHIYHRTGTFIEMHPDGKLVTKVKDSNTVVVNADDNTITLGDSNENVGGQKSTTVNSRMNLVVYGDIDVSSSGNITASAGGNIMAESKGVGGVSVTSYLGEVVVNSARSITLRTAMKANVTAGLGIDLMSAGPVDITAASMVTVNAPIISLN